MEQNMMVEKMVTILQEHFKYFGCSEDCVIAQMGDGSCDKCICETLVHRGCAILNKGDVVLSEKQYEDLSRVYVGEMMDLARKTEIEKFCGSIKELLDNLSHSRYTNHKKVLSLSTKNIILEELIKLAQRYGVEVDE